MKPIYFPFGNITAPLAKKLGSLFGEPAVVYVPSTDSVTETTAALSEQGAIDIRLPSEKENRSLKNLVREYRLWVETHHGQGLTFFNKAGSEKPFFDELKPSRIRSDILEKTKEKSAESGEDPLLTARLFLFLAQERQSQNDALARDYSRIEAQEKALFSMMRGETENGESVALNKTGEGIDDPGMYFTGSLIAAWFRLWLQDPVCSPVFVTDSFAVWDQLAEAVPESETSFQIGSEQLARMIAAPESDQRREFVRTLESLANGKSAVGLDGGADGDAPFGPLSADGSVNAMHIRSVSITGIPPFFASGAGNADRWVKMADFLSPFKNILIIFSSCKKAVGKP